MHLLLCCDAAYISLHFLSRDSVVCMFGSCVCEGEQQVVGVCRCDLGGIGVGFFESGGGV